MYSAIDLGTNNCRMLVARTTCNGFQVVDSFSRIVRLGEGAAKTGSLSEDAVNRTIDALKVCAEKMELQNVSHARSIATEACRKATNCQKFFGRVKAETGISLEAISTEEEARLTLIGCSTLLDSDRPYALLFDIGGGSTEVSWVETTENKMPTLLATTSIPCGVVTLSEKYGGGTPTPRDYTDMVERITRHFESFDNDNGISGEIRNNRVQMLGTSGTVTMLGGVSQGLTHYQRSRVDGMTLDFTTIAETSAKLTAMTCAERAAFPCIGQGRADLVAAGCAILEAICTLWPAGKLRVADRGIREGLLLGMMSGAELAASPLGA
ncbi:MAG: Ppx/GppA family phosphatase [Rhodospirillales bacterium]|nr:Ppx/GppA family phosphatase [Rhodospirillales bacterium]